MDYSATPGPSGRAPDRVPSDQEKALSKDLQKIITKALSDREKDHKRFASNRTLLRGYVPTSDTETGKKMRINLHFANLSSVRPQVYAKDPEFTVQPTQGVPQAQIEAARAFGETAEALLTKLIIIDGQLKRRAKRLLTSVFTNAVGWWKLSWQQGRPADPLIQNRLKDAQDNLAKLQMQRAELKEPEGDPDLKEAELKETIAGLQVQAEKRIGRGLALDFVMPDDMLVLDASVFEVQDYMRACRLAQRVWMTRDQYKVAFGYDPEKAKVYADKTAGGDTSKSNEEGRGSQLLQVFEVWDQDQNRVHTVCTGEDGLCRESYSPDWTGERWFPFFLLAWNEIDGTFFPPSDVELTDLVVREYNKNRDDLEMDRADCRPFTLYRKGGQLTPVDVENIRNRKNNDMIGVEAVGNQSLDNDVKAVTFGTMNPLLYDTTPARADNDMIIGGGDAARGAVLKAKTATEAEILSQGLKSRSAERTDMLEDLLSEVGSYALEVMLRKLTKEEVQKIAGEDASWPTAMPAEDVFALVTVRVRGGSTGKPDRLQEQDRWIKLLPVIKDTVKEIVAVRQAGEEGLAQMAMALLKETMRRFDESFDVEQYLPEQDKQDPNAQAQPQIPPELIAQVQEQMQALQQRAEEAEQKLLDKQADIMAGVKKSEADAAAKVDIARITAPIEAAAEVEAQRIKSEAQAMAQMHAASLQADGANADRMQGDAENAELQGISQELAGLRQFQEQVAAFIEKIGQPKPRMKVAHVVGPDGSIVESKLVPDEAEV